MENKNVMIFGGDSFTWGEGLELYLDNPFWINERNNLNGWVELEPKQTLESIEFRESNRFAGIVSNKFNCNQITLDYNGGGFDKPAELITNNLDKNPKAVVYQFTIFDRMLLHFDESCSCEFCNSKYGNVRPLMLYLDCMNKQLQNIPITERDMFFLNWLEKYENIPFIEMTKTTYIEDIVEMFMDMFKRNLDVFVDKHLSKWLETTNVYLIDSWDGLTSGILSEHPILKKYLIPLKGYDGKYYKQWSEWENTFPYSRIQYEFPNTENGHPTLIQHQYLAESIIEQIEK
jgi:hypothetical protein